LPITLQFAAILAEIGKGKQILSRRRIGLAAHEPNDEHAARDRDRAGNP